MLKTITVRFQIDVNLLEKLMAIQDAADLPFDSMVVLSLAEFAEPREASQAVLTAQAR